MLKLQLIILFFLPIILLGQTLNDTTFTYELGLSINRTFILQDDNISNDKGIGVYSNFYLSHDEHLNFIFGAEYNIIRFKQDWVYAGHFASYSDVSYTIHTLSLPLTARLSLGKKTKFIYDFGAAIDIRFAASMNGMSNSYSVDTNNHLINQYKPFSKNGTLLEGAKNFDVVILNSLGLMFLTHGYTFIIKMTYDYGLLTFYNLKDTKINNSYAKISIGVILNKNIVKSIENSSP